MHKLKAYTAAESFAIVFEELFKEPADQTAETQFAIVFPSGREDLWTKVAYELVGATCSTSHWLLV